jgi:predicted Zn-dependent peptidase
MKKEKPSVDSLLTKNHFNFFTFPNGLRLITVPMEHTESVTVLVLVATGSRYETKEINGISHFLEHMMFKGTTNRPKVTDIGLELDSIGAEYNAFTSKEYTGYYIKCAAEKIDLALDVISDIFQNSKFDAAEIEKEKGVIIEEINMYQDTPARYVGDIFEELLYGDQPLGWHVTGPKEVVKRLTRDDFLEYFRTHYFDKNTVISVAGNIEPTQAKAKVEKYFANIRDNKLLKPLPVVEKQDKPQFKILSKKTDQTHFVLGFRAFNYFSEKEPILGVISLVLSAGFSSRLWSEFRDKRGLSYYVRAANSAYADTGYFEISAGVDNNRLIEALQVALSECRKLIEEPITESELKKVKDYAQGKLAIGLETSDELASFYADQELLKREILTPEERLAKIIRVTSEDIQAVAREIFVPEKLNLAIIGPLKENSPEVKKILNSW